MPAGSADVAELGELLVLEIEHEHGLLHQVGDVEAIAVVRDREARRLGNAAGRKLLAGQECGERIGERRVAGQVLLARDRAHELDARGQRRRRPDHLRFRGRRRRRRAAREDCHERRDDCRAGQRESGPIWTIASVEHQNLPTVSTGMPAKCYGERNRASPGRD